ncbi:MAG: hypothetical protein J6B25_02440 [Clostridia bacterium]|nr:hypothetical protein [Clostridia bacterium]
MKKMLRFVIPAVIILVGIYYAVDTFILTQQEPEPQVFEQGNYTDYYYLTLDEDEKKVYTAVKEQIYSFPATISAPAVTKTQLENVLNALICDNPMMFMFNTCSLDITDTNALFVPEYTMSLSEYTQCEESLEAVIASLEQDMPDGDFEKELFCHDYIVNSCTYSDTGETHESTVVGALIDGKAKCSGYAKALKLLLNRFGIESVLVSGKATDYSANTQNHMWNAVRIDGSWCYTDPTWNDPVNDDGEQINQHIFFNMTEDMLRRTHNEFEFTYDCNDPSIYYYIRNNAYFESCDSDNHPAIASLISAAVNSGEEKAEIMFADKESANLAFDCLFTDENIYRILETANLSANRELITDRIKYTVNENENLITFYFSEKE